MKEDRQDTANEAAKAHRDWKIQAHTMYQLECEEYVNERKVWD